MDTSETYVKMCEKAEEIQPEYLNYGDYYIWVSGNWYIWSDDFQSKKTKERIWLPRQDQLQEIFGEGVNLLGGEVQLIWEYMRSFGGKEGWRPETFEQLWLAFVMAEKYGKIWSQEKIDWIPILENPELMERKK